jgi:hypothetical protein
MIHDIFSDEFDAAVKAAIAEACAETLKAGVALFYLDHHTGLEVMEMPDGRMFEIRYLPGQPGDRNHEVLRELPPKTRQP